MVTATYIVSQESSTLNTGSSQWDAKEGVSTAQETVPESSDTPGNDGWGGVVRGRESRPHGCKRRKRRHPRRRPLACLRLPKPTVPEQRRDLQMDIGERQRKLSLWAAQDKELQLYDLYGLLYNMP